MPVESIPRHMSHVYVSTPHDSGRYTLRGVGVKDCFRSFWGVFFPLCILKFLIILSSILIFYLHLSPTMCYLAGTHRVKIMVSMLQSLISQVPILGTNVRMD